MIVHAHRAYFGVFLFVLAPLAAVVLMAALLLFGAEPRMVFAPGRLVQSVFDLCGVRVPNSVAVVSTGLFWWGIVAAIGFAWERRRQRR